MIFSLRSPLLSQTEYRDSVAKAVSLAQENIIIISAFIKLGGLEWIHSHLKKNIKVKVLCRWTELDILQNSSDLEIYNFCKKHNWEFSIISNLHAKIICVDHDALFLGSSNLTNRGMCLLSQHNEEVGVHTKLAKGELGRIENLFEKSKVVDDELYELYKNWLNANKEKFKVIEFSDEIKKYVKYDLDNLWVKDFPSTTIDNFITNFNQNADEIEHTKEILNLNYNKTVTINLISQKLINSKIYMWIKNQMKSQNTNEFYFGKLSELIHSQLLDDPLPYRREVKDLQVNLYSFLKKCKTDKFKIDIPYSRSERLTIYDI